VPASEAKGKTLESINRLRKAITLHDIASLLDFTPSGLSYILYKIPNALKYNSFPIQKRGGGKRLIRAPVPRLALLQKRLAVLLYNCVDDLKSDFPPRRSLAHGFERGRSIVSNANLHKRRRYVFNLDLKEFFPSINFGRVRGLFINDRRFLLHPDVATVLAQIACFDNELPQGSPCSPVISNLVGHILDSRLARFAKTHKCTYSRYADDITFSTSRKVFPTQIGCPKSALTASWEVSSDLRARVQSAGYFINDSKTRMQLRGSRQITTGLMVNEKVNIRR